MAAGRECRLVASCRASCAVGARLVRATEANVVALQPAAIAIYLDTVEEIAKALSVSDAKAACLELRELIDCIVVAPRVKPGDPIHFEVRGRLASSSRVTLIRFEAIEIAWRFVGNLVADALE